MNENHRLNRVYIEGFRSIKKLDIEIRALNILIGQNGAGKSNFIGMFKFVRDLIEGRLQVYTGENGGANKILYYGSKQTPVLKIELDFPPNHYKFSLLPTTNDSFIFENEYCEFDTRYRYSENINNGGNESQLTKVNTRVSKYVEKVLKEWRVYHFHDTSKSARVKKYAQTYDMFFLQEDAGNLAPFLSFIKENSNVHYERIVKTIQLVIPFFKNFILRESPLNKGMMILEWEDNFSDKIFNASELSDGSLRFICLATLLLQPNLPNVILLDEPELGLHPTAITVLSGLLKKASNRAQIIVSTQSVNLVNEFDPEEIIVVDRHGPETKFSRLEESNLKEWLEKYSIGELWDKNVIGGRP